MIYRQLLYSRLMFPEPDAGGGGEPAPAPATEPGNEPAPSNPEPAPTEGGGEEANPFDFGDDDDDGADEGGEPTPDTENALTEAEAEGYTAEQLGVINEVADKYGLDKETRAGLFKDFIEGAQKLEEAENEKVQKEATKTLRQRWGKDFDSRVKDAGRFLNRMGKALGWKQEYIDSWKNPEDVMLAYEISRYFGERGLKGTQQPQSAPQPNVPTKQDARGVLGNLVKAYQRARLGNYDRDKMREASDEHLRINSIVFGDTTRHLPLP